MIGSHRIGTVAYGGTRRRVAVTAPIVPTPTLPKVYLTSDRHDNVMITEVPYPALLPNVAWGNVLGTGVGQGTLTSVPKEAVVMSANEDRALLSSMPVDNMAIELATENAVLTTDELVKNTLLTKNGNINI